MRKSSLGNKCGHDKRNPKLFVNSLALDQITGFIKDDKAYERFPDVLKFGVKEVDTLYTQFIVLNRKTRRIGGIKIEVLEKSRKVRTERMEAICRIAKYFLIHTNLANHCWLGKDDKGVSLETIAACCNLTVQRVERALQAMVALGWVDIKARKKLRGRNYQTSLRRLSLKFWKLLGLADMLEKSVAIARDCKHGTQALDFKQANLHAKKANKLRKKEAAIPEAKVVYSAAHKPAPAAQQGPRTEEQKKAASSGIAQARAQLRMKVRI